MIDDWGRTIDYLRISVTDRCNLRCLYCMPPDGVAPLDHDDILRYEEILRLARVAATLGLTRFRVSGGEPLVRRGLAAFLADLTATPGCERVALTTNGLLLADQARDLATSGVASVNVSLDTLDPVRMGTLCGGGPPSRVVAGIDAALAQGMAVKLNTVLLGPVLDEVPALLDLAESRGIPIRFIEYMPIDPGAAARAGEEPVPAGRLLESLSRLGSVETTAAPSGCGPSAYHRLSGRNVVVGVIAAVSEPFCARCNRLRLTADGRLKPCLASTVEIDTRSALRRGATDEELAALLRRTAAAKPKDHALNEGQGPGRAMHRIGG